MTANVGQESGLDAATSWFNPQWWWRGERLGGAASLRVGPLSDSFSKRKFKWGHVAGYKQLREVEFEDDIPKLPSGKILGRVLMERERSAAGR